MKTSDSDKNNSERSFLSCLLGMPPLQLNCNIKLKSQIEANNGRRQERMQLRIQGKLEEGAHLWTLWSHGDCKLGTALATQAQRTHTI